MASKTTKQLSYERRKAARRIKALQKIGRSKSISSQARGLIKLYEKELKKASRASMQRTSSGKVIKSHTTEEYKQNALRNLQEVNERYSSYVHSMASQNKVTQSEINIASVGGESRYTQQQVKAFYRQTMHIWMKRDASGAPMFDPKQRNEAIMSYYGETSLERVFQKVISEIEEEKLQSKVESGEVTQEEVDLAKEIIRNRSQYSDDEVGWAYETLKTNDTSEGIKSPISGTNGQNIPDIAPAH